MTKRLSDLSLYASPATQGVKVGDILVINNSKYLIVSNDKGCVFLANLKTGRNWSGSCTVTHRNNYLTEKVLEVLLGNRHNDFENIEVILSGETE